MRLQAISGLPVLVSTSIEADPVHGFGHASDA
jgi:hypothetical protein